MSITRTTDLRLSLIQDLNILSSGSRCVIAGFVQKQSEINILFRDFCSQSSFYQASMPRQFATDLPPDIEQTALKDEPKDWYIKTADFGDEYDRVLQHRDGSYTQLFEDIAQYHHIFHEGCDRIVLLRPPTYLGYDIQLTAAMQCLGYTKEQFQVVIIQPIKLYAFHNPTQKLHAIPDLPADELIQAIGMDAVRWHSFSTPLSEIAPINISTAGQPLPQNSLYRVQSAHAHCCFLLHQAHQQEIIQLDTTDSWQITSPSSPLAELNWEDENADKLAKLLQSTPEVLQRSAVEIAPYLLCQHLEAISNTYYQWSTQLKPTEDDCILLIETKQTLFDLLENILQISVPNPLLEDV